MFKFHITKIMENEYNDYQIILPSKMEEIAKAYHAELKNLINLKNSPPPNNHDEYLNNFVNKPSPAEAYDLESNQTYKKLINVFKDVYFNLSPIKNYCSQRFYYRKEIQIKSILSLLEELLQIDKNETAALNNQIDITRTSKSYYPKQTYCGIIINSITKLSEALNYTLELFISTNNKTYMHKIHESITQLIIKISELIGECRYRQPF